MSIVSLTSVLSGWHFLVALQSAFISDGSAAPGTVGQHLGTTQLLVVFDQQSTDAISYVLLTLKKVSLYLTDPV